MSNNYYGKIKGVTKEIADKYKIFNALVPSKSSDDTSSTTSKYSK
jgi:uncharacterized protein YktA (UPF0223 family)